MYLLNISPYLNLNLNFVALISVSHHKLLITLEWSAAFIGCLVKYYLLHFQGNATFPGLIDYLSFCALHLQSLKVLPHYFSCTALVYHVRCTYIRIYMSYNHCKFFIYICYVPCFLHCTYKTYRYIYIAILNLYTAFIKPIAI